MIISKTNKRIVLNLQYPNRVLTTVPTARMFKYKGHDLVAVPHNIDETQVLRNMGFKVPSPIETQYGWPGRFTPMASQLETSAFLSVNNRAFCLSQMGTGKTVSVLWAYDFLRQQGSVRKMLVVSPLSTLERTWADEVFNHFPHLSTSVVHGSKERRIRMLRADVDIYIINHDGVKVMEKELISRTDIDVVTIDELASFRNASTDRWKAINRVIAGRKRVWGLTGTPTPNAPTDAWAQCRLISPERVPKFAGAFRDATMRQVSQFKWVPKDTATDTVHQAMQPSIRFMRKDCMDLPPCVYQPRHVDMSTEQKKAYREMMTSLYTEVQTGKIQAVNEAVKMQKLVQIACGAVYTQGGGSVLVPSQSRIAETIEIIEQAGSKTIVYVPFTNALEAVAKELSKKFTVEIINGSTSKSARDVIIRDFQYRSDPQVLVAAAGAISHGVTLTAASVIVWYAPVTSAEIYTQASDRITRPGQTLSQLIVNIEGSPVERKLYAALKDRQAMEGLLLKLVAEQEDC